MRFLDANVFDYHFSKDPNFSGHASKILKGIEEGEVAVTSTLVIGQVCSYLRWKKSAQTVPVFLELLQSLTSLVKDETQFSDYVEAVNIQHKEHLPWKEWGDLVIAAQMKRLGVTEIYSNDEDFDRIKGIKRVFS